MCPAILEATSWHTSGYVQLDSEPCRTILQRPHPGATWVCQAELASTAAMLRLSIQHCEQPGPSSVPRAGFAEDEVPERHSCRCRQPRGVSADIGQGPNDHRRRAFSHYGAGAGVGRRPWCAQCQRGPQELLLGLGPWTRSRDCGEDRWRTRLQERPPRVYGFEFSHEVQSASGDISNRLTRPYRSSSEADRQ
jgi:hypothetical protein